MPRSHHPTMSDDHPTILGKEHYSKKNNQNLPLSLLLCSEGLNFFTCLSLTLTYFFFSFFTFCIYTINVEISIFSINWAALLSSANSRDNPNTNFCILTLILLDGHPFFLLYKTPWRDDLKDSKKKLENSKNLNSIA